MQGFNYFSAMMINIFLDLVKKVMEVFMDDIIVYGNIFLGVFWELATSITQMH